MAQRDEKDLRDDGESGPRDDGELGPRDDDESAPKGSGGKALSSPEGFIPPHGGYEHLYSYQKALIVFDATVYFCRRFIDKKDRPFATAKIALSF